MTENAAENAAEGFTEADFAGRFGDVLDNVQRIILGKRDLIHALLICLIAEGQRFTSGCSWLREDDPGQGHGPFAWFGVRAGAVHS